MPFSRKYRGFDFPIYYISVTNNNRYTKLHPKGKCSKVLFNIQSFMFIPFNELIQSPACTFCSAPEDNTANLLSCTQSTAVTSPLLRCLSDHADNITPQKIVLLNIPTAESMELPVAWIVSSCLMIVLEDRVAGRVTRFATCQAELKMETLYFA